jgi:holo-[acyl-carrier protein] synthase
MSLLIGVDLVAIATVVEMLDGPMRERYLARVFTQNEVDDSQTPRGIDPRRLAACFAAKEAVIKVLPAGAAIALTSIELRRASEGAARVELSGQAAELAAQARITISSVSVACDGGYAIATLLAEPA